MRWFRRRFEFPASDEDGVQRLLPTVSASLLSHTVCETVTSGDQIVVGVNGNVLNRVIWEGTGNKPYLTRSSADLRGGATPHLKPEM
jgi:hypothetical protein